MAQPSLWLPVVLGLAFYGVLTLAPRLTLPIRVGWSLFFFAGACLLWLASGTVFHEGRFANLRFTFQALVGTLGACGLVVALASQALVKKGNRVAFGALCLVTVLGWMVAYFSSSHGAASPMVDWVMRVLGLDGDSANTLVGVGRKMGHFLFYGCVALTGLAVAARNGASRGTATLAALLTALTFATFDEMRQTTQPDRGGSGWDVLLDMAGATVAVALVGVAAKSAVRPTTGRKSTTL